MIASIRNQNLQYILIIHQIMLAQDNCPICQRQYNTRSRKEMMLCMSQHFVCLCCADEIAEKDARCPFCKKEFQIQEIQPRRIARQPLSQEQLRMIEKVQETKLKIGLCPSKHLSGKFKGQYLGCNSCGQQKRSQFICKICRYTICAVCTKQSHQEICGFNEWVYDQEYKGCNICGQQKRSGKTCRNCSMRICALHD